jgi:hypothetical protein
MTSALSAKKAGSLPLGDADLQPVRGEVRFVDTMQMPRLQGAVESAGLLPVIVEPPELSSRGKLRDAIESAIEAALESRGAPAPGFADSSDLGATLSDQLYRARAVGARGLSVHIGPLSTMATLAGALDAEDSAVVRWWLAATQDRPVALLIDASNRRLGAYGPPTQIEKLVGTGEVPGATADAGDSQPPASAEIAIPVAATGPEPVAEPTPGPVFEDVTDPGQLPTAEPEMLPQPSHEAKAPRSASRPDPSPPPTLDECKAWAAELEATRGPKPLSAVERLFTERYVPLSDAVSRGGGDAAVRTTLASWSESFAKSYTEAFGALRVTGKRPLMVLDAPSLATRIARLHGAKSVQMVLVDGMRFDLGMRVERRMHDLVGAHATCTDRLLLWAALPTTTSTQLELIARGPDGLAASHPQSERDVPVLPTRSSGTPRRMRVGSRDMVKLDLAAARLRDSGPGAAERLDALADDVAASLVQHAKSLAPRTLMFVFGDHGFRLDPVEHGATGPAVYGGATPDEVLVPAFAWLLSALH